MKIFLDTNVLISAFVFGGNIRKQLVELLDSKHEVCVSKYVDEEFRKIKHFAHGCAIANR